jgi:Mn2+/Fe2+ NRAMP family transporter
MHQRRLVFCEQQTRSFGVLSGSKTSSASVHKLPSLSYTVLYISTTCIGVETYIYCTIALVLSYYHLVSLLYLSLVVVTMICKLLFSQKFACAKQHQEYC